MSKNLAIVPAYNEVGAIASTIADILEHAPGFDVLVVDDGSTDATAQRAREAGAEVIQPPFNLGIGGAVQAGYLYAREQGYDVAVQVDGDGQHAAGEIQKLLDHLQANPGLNMVTGSRFVDEGQDGFRSSAVRRIGIRFFAVLLSVITRQRVTDPTSGFRMCDREAIELFARDYPHDYPEVEAVLMLHAHRLSREEVAVTMRARTTGASSIRPLHSGLYMVKVLLAIMIGLLRARPNVESGDPAAVTAKHGL